MNFYLIAAFLACCLVVPAQLGSPCPTPTTILPCRCAKSGPDTVISCSYHDPELLKIAFDAISSERMIVDFFNISSTRLNVVEANFFQNMTVRCAMLYGDRWSSIDDDAFVHQERSLARLTIKESLLTSVPVTAISILKDLEYFAMVNSEVTAVEDAAFDSLESAMVLRTVDLSHNYIKTIGDGAFAKLTALEHLILSNNRISELKTAILPSGNRIKVLNAGSNRLESVPGDISELPIGATVNLNDNSIEILSGVDLHAMIQNKLYVFLNNNPLKFTCAMSILALTTEDRITGTCTKSGITKSLTSLQKSDFSDCFLLNKLKGKN